MAVRELDLCCPEPNNYNNFNNLHLYSANLD